MFERATITLGIGPHSSCLINDIHCVHTFTFTYSIECLYFRDDKIFVRCMQIQICGKAASFEFMT